MTKMRSTKGHELTRNVVSVFSCHFVDRIGRQGFGNSRVL